MNGNGLLYPDIAVGGVGRTGTSTTARILQEFFGVCMGHHCFKASEAQPLGSYEDSAMMAPTKRLIKDLITPMDWIQSFTRAHQDCSCRLKGVKITHLAALRAEHWKKIRPRLIVKTYRPIEPSVASLQRWRGGKVGDWVRFYKQREESFNTALKGLKIPSVVICFEADRRTPDEEIAARLKPHVERL
jgi:hypothetical protein